MGRKSTRSELGKKGPGRKARKQPPPEVSASTVKQKRKSKVKKPNEKTRIKRKASSTSTKEVQEKKLKLDLSDSDVEGEEAQWFDSDSDEEKTSMATKPDYEDDHTTTVEPLEQETSDNFVSNMQEGRQRAHEILHILSNFKSLCEEGKSRSEYLQMLHEDLKSQYGYSDYLLSKFIELVPTSQLMEFLDASEAPRPLTIRTNKQS